MAKYLFTTNDVAAAVTTQGIKVLADLRGMSVKEYVLFAFNVHRRAFFLAITSRGMALLEKADLVSVEFVRNEDYRQKAIDFAARERPDSPMVWNLKDGNPVILYAWALRAKKPVQDGAAVGAG